MSLNIGQAFTGQPAYIILDANGNVVRSHNLTFAGTPTNNSDAILQALSSRYKMLREIPLSNGNVLIVMSIQ